MTKRARMPRRRNLRGRGGFFDDLRSGWNKFAGWTNNAGKPFMNAGRNIADAFVPGLGGKIKNVTDILGLGAYGIKQNTILASPVPDMHAIADRGVRIRHKEFVTDVKSATDFTLTQLRINPGLPDTFPWLSAVAGCFQKYEIKGLVFYLNSTSASALNSTNTALGTIVGAVQYNPYAAPPANKVDMLALAGSMGSKPNLSQMYPLECAPDMTVYRTHLLRSDDVTDDLAKYDAGIFNIGAVGSQAASVCGELWVSYDIVLKEPKRVYQGWSAHYGLAWPNPSNYLGTMAAATSYMDNIGIVFDQNILTLPAAWVGKFKIQLYMVGNSTAVQSPTLTASGAVGLNVYNNQTTPTMFVPANGETCTHQLCEICVNKTLTSAATLTFSSGTKVTAMTACELNVEQLDGKFV